MTEIAHRPALIWAAGHRLLLIAIVIALAAVVAITVVLLGTGRTAPAATTTVGGLSVADDGCSSARPGQPC